MKVPMFADNLTVSNGTVNVTYEATRGREVLSPTQTRHVRQVPEVDDSPEYLTMRHDLNGRTQRSSVRLSKVTVDPVTGKQYEMFAQFTLGFTRGQHTEAKLTEITNELKNTLAIAGFTLNFAKLGT